MKTALAFSGGKDSWACLWLNRERLASITVLWVNTGKNFPELLQTIELARSMCPDFVEVKVDRDAQNAQWGLPADVVPVQWTHRGQFYSGGKDIMVQSYLDCCIDNIGAPLHRRALALGCTHLIRGQRMADGHQSPARNRSEIDGLIYLQPIEQWSDAQVLAFVAAHMPLPEHFKLKHTSMDCYDCTAYRKETRDCRQWAQDRHPQLHARYLARAAALNSAIEEALN